MRHLWSEYTKRLLWRQIWVALAEVQKEFSLVTAEQVEDLRAHMRDVNIPRALEIERLIQHDLMAELKAFAEQCPTGGRILHLGATSMDIEDNAEALRIRRSLEILCTELSKVLLLLADKIEAWADQPVLGYTHLQPAEPITLGYRLAIYAQDLLEDYRILNELKHQVRGKGFKGAVGSAASYARLIGPEHLERFEQALSERLDLPFFPVTGQTYPRKQDYQVLSALAGLGASLYKFAFDLRILQSPGFGELREPFGAAQVGSSAMPFKRNPIRAERINSLARILAHAPLIAWENAAHSLLERTLDDSANRRSLLPEAFLAADELLHLTFSILQGLEIDTRAIERNLESHLPFAAIEPLLMALTQAGADRQQMHEHLRDLSIQAWQSLQSGQPNPLPDLLLQDSTIARFLSSDDIMQCLSESREHLGASARWARALARTVRQTVRELSLNET